MTTTTTAPDLVEALQAIPGKTAGTLAVFALILLAVWVFATIVSK